MAGIKNHLQQLGIGPLRNKMDNIKDPIERHMAFLSMRATPYCRLCGKEILMNDRDEDGLPVNWEYEMRVLAHVKCIEKERARRASEGR